MNERTRPLDLDTLPSHCVRALGALAPDALQSAAERAGMRWVAVDLAGSNDKAAVLRAIAQGFAFPDWFGHNLDALYDSLTDLPHGDGRGWVVLLRHLPRSAGFDADQRAALLDVFRDAAEAHAEDRLPFRVFWS